MKIEIRNEVLNSFIQDIKKLHYKKTFGFFLSDKKNGNPVDYIFFENDKRDEINFEEVDEYYVDNKTAGFTSDPIETYRVEREIKKRNLFVVGVFHCHMRHPTIFANIDQKFHPSKKLWHLIISIRNIEFPEISIYYYDENETLNETQFSVIGGE